jgi:hypothetical protein
MSDFKCQEDEISRIFNKAISCVFGGKKDCKLTKQEFDTLIQICIGATDEDEIPDIEIMKTVIDKMNVYGREISIANGVPVGTNFNGDRINLPSIELENVADSSILDREKVLDALEEIPRSTLIKKSEVTELLYKLIALLEWA